MWVRLVKREHRTAGGETLWLASVCDMESLHKKELLVSEMRERELQQEKAQQAALTRAYEAEKAALLQAREAQSETQALLEEVRTLNRDLQNREEEITAVNRQISTQLDTFLLGINGGSVINSAEGEQPFLYVSEAAARNQGFSVNEFMERFGAGAARNICPGKARPLSRPVGWRFPSTAAAISLKDCGCVCIPAVWTRTCRTKKKFVPARGWS